MSWLVKVQKQVNIEADWLKKVAKLQYGYKCYTAINNEGLMLAVESKQQPLMKAILFTYKMWLIKQILKQIQGYQQIQVYISASNCKYLKDNKLKDDIMYKAEKINHSPIVKTV